MKQWTVDSDVIDDNDVNDVNSVNDNNDDNNENDDNDVNKANNDVNHFAESPLGPKLTAQHFIFMMGFLSVSKSN